MNQVSLRRSATGLVVTSVALAGLAAVPAPAHAAPNLDGGLATRIDFDEDMIDCTVTSNNEAPLQTFTDNGVVVTQNWVQSGTSTSDTTPADVTDLAVSSSTTISATRIGADGATAATIKGTARASASAKPRLATSACQAYADMQAQANGSFQLDKPMWATVTAQGNGSGMLQVIAGPSDGLVATVASNRGSGTATALLPAGPSVVSVLTFVRARTTGRRTSTYAGSFTIRLAPLGEASPVSGKGRGHVALGARSCTSNRIAGALTKKVTKAKKVVVTVNGAKAASFQGKKLKKRAFSVRVASGAKAQVTATITLKNGKKVTVSRSYLPCS